MAKDKVNERLEGISQENLEKAQARLNKLCDQYNMQRITLTHGKNRWRELCFRIIGLPPHEANSAGRSAMMKKEEQDYFVGYMDIIDEFSVFDEGSDGTIKKTTVDEKIALYSKKNAPKDHTTEHTNKTFTGIKRLKNFWKNFGRTHLDKLAEEELRARQDEDWSDHPAEYYDNFYKDKK